MLHNSVSGCIVLLYVAIYISLCVAVLLLINTSKSTFKRYVFVII